MKRIARYPGLVMFVFFLLFYLSSQYVLGLVDPFLRTSMSALIAFFLSPRRKYVETQQGLKKQITWVFLKEPIILE